MLPIHGMKLMYCKTSLLVLAPVFCNLMWKMKQHHFYVPYLGLFPVSITKSLFYCCYWRGEKSLWRRQALHPVGYGVIFVTVIKVYVHQMALLERHRCRLDGSKSVVGRASYKEEHMDSAWTGSWLGDRTRGQRHYSWAANECPSSVKFWLCPVEFKGIKGGCWLQGDLLQTQWNNSFVPHCYSIHLFFSTVLILLKSLYAHFELRP